MYKRILAVLGGPPCWDVVRGQVERLAGGRDVEVILLMVVEPPTLDAGRRRLKGELEGFAADLRQRGIAVQTALRHGSQAQALLSYSKAHPVDVIVMAAPPLAA